VVVREVLVKEVSECIPGVIAILGSPITVRIHLNTPTPHAFTRREFNLAAAASPEAQVSSTQSLESNAVGPDDIRVDRLSRGRQPGIVLAHPAFRATLQKGTAPRLGKMHPMDRKPLQ
jgi:hypothetical protein